MPLDARILPVDESRAREDLLLLHFREPFETWDPTAKTSAEVRLRLKMSLLMNKYGWAESSPSGRHSCPGDDADFILNVSFREALQVQPDGHSEEYMGFLVNRAYVDAYSASSVAGHIEFPGQQQRGPSADKRPDGNANQTLSFGGRRSRSSNCEAAWQYVDAAGPSSTPLFEIVVLVLNLDGLLVWDTVCLDFAKFRNRTMAALRCLATRSQRLANHRGHDMGVAGPVVNRMPQ